MNNESILKAFIMFGGGFLLFSLLKPKGSISNLLKDKQISSSKTSFDAKKEITKSDKEKAKIVVIAYQQAFFNGENEMTLADLNNECLLEYGMQCSQKKDGTFVVYDKLGREILSV